MLRTSRGGCSCRSQPDIVAIEPATRRLIGNLFDCRDLGTIDTTKGAKPLQIWQVLERSAIANRFEALRGLTLSPLIGRDQEIDVLLHRWARAKAGDGQVVLVSSEPGLGKSRLAAALEERLCAEPHTRLRYQCSPYHRDSVLHPFVVALGRAARLAAEDPAETQLEKLEAILAPARIAETAPLFASLLSIPTGERYSPLALSAAQQRRLTLAALLDQLEALARQKPVLMLFEDVHWADASSLEVLDLTVERVRALPVLALFTFRPEYEAPWTGLSHVTSIALDRLGPAEVETLAEHVAGRPLPPEVTAQIVAKTDGVPLFVEELTKTVLEGGLLVAGRRAGAWMGHCRPSPSRRHCRIHWQRVSTGWRRSRRSRRSVRRSAANSPTRCCALSPAATSRRCARHWRSSKRRSCCSARVRRPMRATPSSTRWSKTPPTKPCSRAGGRSCTARLPTPCASSSRRLPLPSRNSSPTICRVGPGNFTPSRSQIRT